MRYRIAFFTCVLGSFPALVGCEKPYAEISNVRSEAFRERTTETVDMRKLDEPHNIPAPDLSKQYLILFTYNSKDYGYFVVPNEASNFDVYRNGKTYLHGGLITLDDKAPVSLRIRPIPTEADWVWVETKTVTAGAEGCAMAVRFAADNSQRVILVEGKKAWVKGNHCNIELSKAESVTKFIDIDKDGYCNKRQFKDWKVAASEAANAKRDLEASRLKR